MIVTLKRAHKKGGTGGFDFMLMATNRLPKISVSRVGYYANSVTLYLDFADADCNYVRVQIIKRK